MLVRFDRVNLRYPSGPDILKDVSFGIEAGSFHYICGPSGAGKTSLLKLLYLGLKPASGHIHMLGQDITSLPKEKLTDMRRQVGIVFQNFGLLNHLSVFDNVALPLRIAGIHKKEINKNVLDLLKWIGLGNYIDSKPSTLSGGEQQRVAIARAVVHHPKLLLADEPTGNVDEEIGQKILRLFEELNRMGTTVMIATHDTNLIRQFPHPVLFLEKSGSGIRNTPNYAEAA